MLRPARDRTQQHCRLADGTGQRLDVTWLPQLRDKKRVWWLPLDIAGAVGLTEVLTLAADYNESGAQAAAFDVLHTSPTTTIWAALSWLEETQCRTAVVLTLRDLSCWLASGFAQRWVLAESYGEPPTLDENMLQRWKELQANYFDAAEPTWLSQAAAWLEVTGPKVSESWRSKWPQLQASGATDSNIDRQQTRSETFQHARIPLANLARQSMDVQRLRQRFNSSVQAAKREAIYQLAYGLSHEINNPLTNIAARAQQMLQRETDPQRQRSLRSMCDQSQRAHEMIADLMLIARPPKPVHQSLVLKTWVAELVKEYGERSSTEGVRLSLDSDPIQGVERATFDPHLLGDALRALLDNAFTACADGGHVELGWRNIAGQIVFSIRDDGPGLSAADQRHAFDPYYSGRESGRGLGMGLSKVECIAKLHGGAVAFYGTGPGCEVRLTLPSHA